MAVKKIQYIGGMNWLDNDLYHLYLQIACFSIIEACLVCKMNIVTLFGTLSETCYALCELNAALSNSSF